MTTRTWLIWSSIGSVAVIAAGVGLIPALVRRNGAAPAKDEVRSISFLQLSGFPYTPPPKQKAGAETQSRPDPFPPEVRALHGAKVSIAGFMVPFSMDNGRVESFFLSRGVLRCCYADAPRINDYIRVTMPPGRYAPNMEIVRVIGALEVGEEVGVQGQVESVYHLIADSVQAETAQGLGWVETVVWGIGGLIGLALFGPIGVQFVKHRQQRRRERGLVSPSSGVGSGSSAR